MVWYSHLYLFKNFPQFVTISVVKGFQFSSVQFSSVTQSCPTLCDPMNRSTPGLPVHQQLPEFIQTHVHRVADAIQPSHPLSAPSPPAPNPSQHQGFFQWVSSSHEVAKVLELQLQRQSLQWTPGLTSFRPPGNLPNPFLSSAPPAAWLCPTPPWGLLPLVRITSNDPTAVPVGPTLIQPLWNRLR